MLHSHDLYGSAAPHPDCLALPQLYCQLSHTNCKLANMLYRGWCFHIVCRVDSNGCVLAGCQDMKLQSEHAIAPATCCSMFTIKTDAVAPGALDLKPEVFQGAFASGVVGALTASQQVTCTLCL